MSGDFTINAECGYSFNICSGTKKNHWSTWPLAGPPWCTFDKYTNPIYRPSAKYYLKIQLVTHRKHMSLSQRPTLLCSYGKYSVLIVGVIRNKYVHRVGKVKCLCIHISLCRLLAATSTDSKSLETRNWSDKGITYRQLTASEQDQDGSVLILLASSCQQTCMTYTTAVRTVKNFWWWTEELPETRSFIPKINLRN